MAAELGAQRGAEELSAVLNVVYDAVLGELHRYRGSVIYFSGDAVTCWLDGDDGLLGVACALAMQRAMDRVADVATPGGARLRLGMKVAVAAGGARRFVVGDPDIQLIDVLAGALMDRLAAAEHEADKGEVVVDHATRQALAGAVEIGAERGHGAHAVSVVRRLAGDVLPPPAPPPYPKLPRPVVRQWLLPPVYERMRSGRGEFLSELRPAVPIFVRFGGIDYDNDPEAHLLLDHFIRRAQRVIDSYGGNLLQLTIGDKGAYLHAVIGCPLAHEDDAARACAAALEILELERATAATGLQVGISSGRVRSGAYGHLHRRAFTCLGDPVNLAARLMQAAPPGQAYATAQVAEEAGDSFSFAELPPLTVKGKSAAIAARRVIGRSAGALQRQRRPARPMVGRTAELGELVAAGERALAGKGQVFAVVAEAGMGKSRLCEEGLRLLGDRGMLVCTGAAASVGSATSYLAWQGIWSSLFEVPPGADALPRLQQALNELDPSLVPRLPLLGTVLGLQLEDNELTQAFDAKLRKSSLESLLLRYLTLRAGRGPLVLLLEDCHWLDPLSVDLLDVVSRVVAALPVLVLLTYRLGPFKAPVLPHTTVVELAQLEEASARHLALSRFTELYGPETLVPEGLLHRLMATAEGNPFYLEELVKYLHAHGADLANPVAAASVELPASLASLVLSRIDTLAEPPRRVLKVASVVGREFGFPVLSGAHAGLGTHRTVAGHLRRLCAHDLLVQEDPSSENYAFKHAVIHEVSYQSVPYALRARLHTGVGTWLEANDPGALDLLAHHFWLATDEERKLGYQLRAGEAAQARYANAAAVDYYRRALPLLPEGARADVLLRLGTVLELRGDWAEAEAVFGEALELAERLGDPAAAARARVARAEPVRKQGRYDDAAVELDLAERTFDLLADQAGRGRVAHLRGTIAAQRGDYPTARANYEQSLHIRTGTGDQRGVASLLSNLAILAEYEDDYDRAQALNQQALTLRTEVDDRWGMGVSLNNLGVVENLRRDHKAARSYLEDALRIELEVGDLWMVAMARHNLGNATRELGDVAATGENYGDALRTFSLIGDNWALPIILEDIAMFVAEDHPGPALRLAGATEAMREATGSPRVAAVVAQLNERLKGARASLAEAAPAEHAAGTRMSAEDAYQLALELCARAKALT